MEERTWSKSMLQKEQQWKSHNGRVHGVSRNCGKSQKYWKQLGSCEGRGWQGLVDSYDFWSLSQKKPLGRFSTEDDIQIFFFKKISLARVQKTKKEQEQLKKNQLGTVEFLSNKRRSKHIISPFPEFFFFFLNWNVFET